MCFGLWRLVDLNVDRKFSKEHTASIYRASANGGIFAVLGISKLTKLVVIYRKVHRFMMKVASIS
jgi:hypothetical protein